MRRILLLAMLVAGSWWGTPREDPGATPVAPASHQLTGSADLGPDAFLRAGSALPLVAFHEDSRPNGPAPTGRIRETDGAHARPLADAAFAARASTHAQHTSDLHFLRAGLSSCHIATPPPFRFV